MTTEEFIEKHGDSIRYFIADGSLDRWLRLTEERKRNGNPIYFRACARCYRIWYGSRDVDSYWHCTCCPLDEVVEGDWVTLDIGAIECFGRMIS